MAAPVNEHPQLTPRGTGKRGQFSGLISRVDGVLGKAAGGEAGQRFEVAGLQTLQIAFELGNGSVLMRPARLRRGRRAAVAS